MAQHGYLHDKYDSDDFGREDDRERGWRERHRDWDDREREQGRWSDRGTRESMFGWRDDEDRSRRGDYDRGFFDRARDEVRSWSRDEDDDRSRTGRNWEGERGFGGGSYGASGRYSAHPDDHYRSWRDKQIQALDRDYQDYCREREQQFHQDFDSWRQNRQGQRSGGSMQSQSSDDVMTLDNPAPEGGEIAGATASPMGTATLGTNNSENTESAPSATGRRRR